MRPAFGASGTRAYPFARDCFRRRCDRWAQAGTGSGTAPDGGGYSRAGRRRDRQRDTGNDPRPYEGYRPDSCGNTRYVRRRRPSIRMFSLIAHEGDAGLGKERRGRSRSDPAPGRAARSSLTTRRSPRWKTARQLDAGAGAFSEACQEAVASMNSSMLLLNLFGQNGRLFLTEPCRFPTPTSPAPA